MVALDNVYTAVKAFAEGKGRDNPSLMKYYAHLVGQGIAGKDA